MKTRQELIDYLTAMERDELSVAVAMAELFRRADQDGRIAPHRVAERVPPETLQRMEAMGLVRWDGPAPRRAGSEGAPTDVAEPDGSQVRISPALWEQIVSHRDTIVNEVERTVADLREPEEPVEVPATSFAPEEVDSRLWAEGLTKIYQRRKVVDDVDISVNQGEIVGLLGPNGAGKTTTFYMMVGLIPPNAGRVHLDDEDITKTPMYRRARRGIGYLAQEPSVFRRLTVEENVLAILETLDLPKREEKHLLDELLQELSIGHLRNSMAYSLSGGERRRLEITRALVQRPKFMLLDEPFAGIDPIATGDIQHIVRELKHRSIGVIISDHNVEQTLDIVDRAYIMYEGRIRVGGTVSELVWNDEVAEIYLGPTLTERMRLRYTRPTVNV